jgi:4-amino-4-deoxy-L-arabinose transferase-like glycosyltransferase
MLRHLFRFATVGAFGRAWAQRSPFWLALGLAVMVFRFLDRRSAQRAKRRHA